MTRSEPGPDVVAVTGRVLEALLADEFTTVLEVTAGVADDDPTPADVALWTNALYARVIALINLGRPEDARVLAEDLLVRTSRVGDEAARAQALAATVWPVYLAGDDETALRRLDEVLAFTETRTEPWARVQALAMAAATAGPIGVSEISDRLLDEVDGIIDATPPGLLYPPLMRYLKTAFVMSRLNLAITEEIAGSGRARALYAGVQDACERALRGEWAAEVGLPEKSAGLFRACLQFARVASGEAVDGIAEPAPADPAAPYDAVVATTGTIDGLARLRAADPGTDLAAQLDTATRMVQLARRDKHATLEAEGARLRMLLTERIGEGVAAAAAREHFELAAAELDWRARMQRARLTTFRSGLLATLMEGVTPR